MMGATKRSHFAGDEWLKAFRAKNPTAHQKRLLKVWRKVECVLDGFDAEYFFNPSGFDCEKTMADLQVDDEGNVTVGVSVHSITRVPLGELVSDDAERTALERDLWRLAAIKAGRPRQALTYS